MFEKCNNNGPRWSKSATTTVPDGRKVQQQWSPMFEKCNDNGGKMFEKCNGFKYLLVGEDLKVFRV